MSESQEAAWAAIRACLHMLDARSHRMQWQEHTPHSIACNQLRRLCHRLRHRWIGRSGMVNAYPCSNNCARASRLAVNPSFDGALPIACWWVLLWDADHEPETLRLPKTAFIGVACDAAPQPHSEGYFRTSKDPAKMSLLRLCLLISMKWFVEPDKRITISSDC